MIALSNPVRRLPLALAAGALLFARAQAFELRPMTQTFEPTGRAASQSFRIINDLDEEVAVSVAIKKRVIDQDGRETLADAEDFVIFPTEILLKPKGSQTVRVKWSGDSDVHVERAYRIIAEEVPLKQAPVRSGGRSMSIKLVLRFGGTVYVAPPQARADVTVYAAASGEPGARKLELVAENRGSRHAIIEHPVVVLRAGGVERRLEEAALKGLAGENILAGGRRRVLLPWPSGLPSEGLEARLEAALQR